MISALLLIRTSHSPSSKDEFFARERESLLSELSDQEISPELVDIGSYSITQLSEIADIITQPTLSPARIICVSLSALTPVGEMGAEESTSSDESSTKKASKKKKNAKQEEGCNIDIPPHVYLRVFATRPLSEDEITIVEHLSGAIETDRDLTRGEVVSQVRSLLPGVSAEVMRYLETYPLEEIGAIAEYLHLGHSDDASSLSLTEVQRIFPQESNTRSYELLDKLLSGDMTAAMRIYDDLTALGSLWGLLPTMRTQLRKYLSALHMSEAGISVTQIESVSGIKVFVLDRLRRSRMTSQKMVQLLLGILDIHRAMITGEFGGKSEPYVLVRLILLFRQG